MANDKLRSKIKAMKEWIKNHRGIWMKLIFKTINAKLRGDYQYYSVTDIDAEKTSPNRARDDNTVVHA